MSFYNSNGFHQNDLDFAKQHNLLNTDEIKLIESTKNSWHPNDCWDHRRYQEDLRNNHNYYVDQTTWNMNNKICHTYNPLERRRN